MPSPTRRLSADESPRLQVRLLGTVGVVLDGQRLPAFDALRFQRFLGLLAARTRPLRRSRLAAELWADSTEGQARTNLRKLLHDFRQNLPDVDAFVEIGTDAVDWRSDGLSHIDVLAFRDAIASGDLDRAVRLYTGDFLPACCDDWILEERRKLHTEALSALGSLAEAAARRGDHPATLRHAERILDMDGTDEAAACHQMKAHLALGHRTAALRAYHRYAETLERELAVSPDGAIEALYQQLRAGSHRQGETGNAPKPLVDSAFVGRDREWALLYRAWTLARKGRAHLALITGEPGIGKSRLALELRHRVRSEGHLVASTRAYEAAGRLPWGPVVELLRSGPVQRRIESLEAVWKSELARLLPERQDARPNTPAEASGPVAQRHRLFDAVGRALISHDRPQLLVIDDLQWCDAETIELMGFIVRSMPTAPVLIVGTLRQEEISGDHPLTELVTALERDQAVSTIRLDRLDEPSTIALAAQLLGEGALPPELSSRLWSETEGNPLFIVEVLRAGAPGHEKVLTPTMRAVLRTRLTHLSDGARRLTEMAALFGRPFSVSLMASAMGTSEQEAADWIDELWRRRIMQDLGLRYDFSHDKLRAVAVEMVNPARRRLLHKRIAEALSAERADHIDGVSAQLAAHYDQAGMLEPAIDAYRRAGTRAVALSALRDAVALFRRALSLLADLPNSPARDGLELEIRIALGPPLVALEGYGARPAHQLYERALSLCHRLDKPVAPPVLRGLGLARLQGCRFRDSSRLAQALLDDHADDPVARTEGHYLLGVSAFWQGALAKASEHLEAAVEAYEPSRCHTHLVRFAQNPKAVCLVRRAMVELWTGDADRSDETVRAALEFAADLNHLMTSAYVITYASLLAAEAEDHRRLAALLSEADRLWKRVPIGYLRTLLDALHGFLQVHDGSTEGIQQIMHSVRRSRAEAETLHLSYTLLLLARARALAGEFDQGRAAVKDALSWTDRHSQRYLEAELWRIDGELAYHVGDTETASASLTQAARVAHGQGARLLELRAHLSLARRFPGPASRHQLKALLNAMPSGHRLPVFQQARVVLSAPPRSGTPGERPA